MSCKYKDKTNQQHCTVTGGECQFVKSDDDTCPILAAYHDLDKYLEKTAAQSNEK